MHLALVLPLQEGGAFTDKRCQDIHDHHFSKATLYISVSNQILWQTYYIIHNYLNLQLIVIIT